MQERPLLGPDSGAVVHLPLALLVLHPLLDEELCGVDTVLGSRHRHDSDKTPVETTLAKSFSFYLFLVPGL